MNQRIVISIALIFGPATTAEAGMSSLIRRSSLSPDGRVAPEEPAQEPKVSAEAEKKDEDDDIDELDAERRRKKDEEEDREREKFMSSVESPKKCQKPRSKALFCYALIRSPAEPTAVLLAKQLQAGCDGWRLFGHTEDPANNVTKAFSDADNEKGWDGAMHSMVATGVWKYLEKAKALDEYEWFLKVDADSFIRPSTLRRHFKELHGSCACGACTRVYSVKPDYIDGYFVALQADLVLGIKALGLPAMCDIVLAGHKGWNGENGGHDCLKSLGMSHVKTPLDSQGHNLVSMDQNMPQQAWPDEIGGPKECEDIAHMWLQRAAQKRKGPLCECAPIGEHPACISTDFLTIHHVKTAETYSQLMEAFP